MPTTLTIVGLGPGNPAARTLAVEQALAGAKTIIVRTGVHPGLSDLVGDARVRTCDDLYESRERFDEVYRGIVERVADAARTGDVVYAVPGHPFCGEATVGAIIDQLAGSDVDVTVLDGVSAIDSMATFLTRDVLHAEIQILDALSLAASLEREPFGGGQVEIAPTRPCLIMQVYSPSIASSVKLALMRTYPVEHDVAIVTGAGGEQSAEAVWRPLHELDHQAVNHLTTVWIPELDALTSFRTMPMLQRIIARLRAPDGCPWDRAQSHGSLRNAIVEEAYEVLDAIDASDSDALAEELGDLLFQPLMHAQIAEEAGEFTFEDVIEHATRKLIRRHPHVFSDVHAATPSDVIQTWEAVKDAERKEKGQPPRDVKASPFDRLPNAMPATTRVAHILADKRGAPRQVSSSEREALGDALFEAIAALARAGLDPETEIERVARRRMDAAGELTRSDRSKTGGEHAI